MIGAHINFPPDAWIDAQGTVRQPEDGSEDDADLSPGERGFGDGRAQESDGDNGKGREPHPGGESWDLRVIRVPGENAVTGVQFIVRLPAAPK